MSTQHTSRMVSTDQWTLQVPVTTTSASALVCIPTVHPRGDQRILRCTQALLDAGFRVLIIWEGYGEPSDDPAVKEQLLSRSHSLIQRLSKLRGLTKAALKSKALNWHIHDFYMLPSSLMARLRGIRTIYDVHEYYPEYYADKFPRNTRIVVADAISRFQVFAARRVGGANVVAEPMKNAFDRASVPTAVTPNYPSQMRAASLQSDDRSGAIHIGTLSKTYGMEQLIQIGEHLANLESPVTVDLIRKFPNASIEREFLDKLSRSSAATTIRLLDPIPSSEVPSLLRGYAVGLSTIQESGQNDIAVPTKLYEYVLAGMTVVGTERSAQRSFLEEYGRSELFADGDTLSMAQAVVRAQELPAIRSALEAAQFADEHLQWEGAPAESLTALARSIFYV